LTAKRTLSKALGITQTTIGGATMVFAFLLYFNTLNMQTVMGITEMSVELYLWAFIIYGILSIISGIFLTFEK
jgi:hypothetical protein